MTRLVSGLAAALLVVGLMTTAARAGEVLITKDNFGDFFVGNTWLGFNSFGLWKTFIKNNGKLYLETKHNYSDKGEYYFNDDGKFCKTWEKSGGGATRCYKLWVDGVSIRYLEDGGIEKINKLVNGKHEGWNFADWK